ncbi:MAG: GIY-YIG nuclease family protein [Candidatus Shapirobacteria bacterium]|nr:GIY-YIG nuclease family protein [Candidatus Shapirobacteria bacterium]
MYYTCILHSSKSHIFYFGSTIDLKNRFNLYNTGQVRSIKPHLPWKLIWYCGFETEKQARDFELYLKTGSGKAFAYKRLINEFNERFEEWSDSPWSYEVIRRRRLRIDEVDIPSAA